MENRLENARYHSHIWPERDSSRFIYFCPSPITVALESPRVSDAGRVDRVPDADSFSSPVDQSAMAQINYGLCKHTVCLTSRYCFTDRVLYSESSSTRVKLLSEYSDN